jgi:ribosomal protein S18 acetylase RimI-like enzyme
LSLNDVSLETVDSGDLVAVADLHAVQFHDHFLGRLPVSVLMRFYREMSANTVFIAAKADGRLAGFVLGGTKTVLDRNRRRFVTRHWAAILLGVVRRPEIWGQAISRGRSMLLSRGHHAGFVSSAETRLLSITVADSAKGRGVAKELVYAFERALGSTDRYGLSVHDDNSRAIGFYEKMGFQLEGKAGGSAFFLKLLGGAENIE